jgi:hypothetical protein
MSILRFQPPQGGDTNFRLKKEEVSLPAGGRPSSINKQKISGYWAQMQVSALKKADNLRIMQDWVKLMQYRNLDLARTS